MLNFKLNIRFIKKRLCDCLQNIVIFRICNLYFFSKIITERVKRILRKHVLTLEYWGYNVLLKNASVKAIETTHTIETKKATCR